MLGAGTRLATTAFPCSYPKGSMYLYGRYLSRQGFLNPYFGVYVGTTVILGLFNRLVSQHVMQGLEFFLLHLHKLVHSM